MILIRRLIPAALLAVALTAVLAGPAAASRNQEAMFQDDNHLIYVERPELRRHLDTLDRLGVDRLRITVLWQLVAPSPASRTRPDFNAANPDAYPPGAWDRFDAVITEARARGMDVNFNITGPAPLWATQVAPRDDIVDRYEPNPVEFRRFVTAVGRRYSGQWPPSPYVAPGQKVPRVSYWSIWNEPNHSGWLTPTWARKDGHWFERSASLYRELLDAAWAGLADSGHGTDRILIGETAPSGDRSKEIKRYMKPLIFVRALYCVNRRHRYLRGAAAQRLGCPARPADFRKRHPALFLARGYAHHPYQLLTAPNVKPRDRDYVTMGVIRRMSRTLDRIYRTHGSKRHLPLYITEYGYQTPPDPFGVPLRRQASYLNRSEFMAWRNRRVKSVSQFLLFDDGDPVNLTFQSGLLSREGKRKPSFKAYRMPIHARSSVRRGKKLRVWGVVRPAANGTRVVAEVQFRKRGAKKWRRLRRVRTVGSRNSVWTRVRVRRSGHVRIAHGKLHSRAVKVRVKRR